MTFQEACQHVLDQCPNAYAKSYAEAGLRLIDPKAMRIQAIYILNNMGHWRGDIATAVRLCLKELSKEPSKRAKVLRPQ